MTSVVLIEPHMPWQYQTYSQHKYESLSEAKEHHCQLHGRYVLLGLAEKTFNLLSFKLPYFGCLCIVVPGPAVSTTQHDSWKKKYITTSNAETHNYLS